MRILLLFCCISLSLHGMQPPIPYRDQQTQKAYFKELRMQLYESHQKCPRIFNGLGLLYVGVGIYQPALIAGSAIVSSIVTLLTYTQERDKDIHQRKEDKDLIAYMFFANGPHECIEKVCAQDEYEESDSEFLKKQNTPYLIYVLEQYMHTFYSQGDGGKQHTLINYSAALDTLKKNHADLSATLNYFKQKKPLNSFALDWLQKNGTN